MKTSPPTPELKIPFSRKAKEKLAEFNELLNYANEKGIRLGVKKNGAHLKKIIGFDDKRFTDQVYQLDELKVFIDRRELKHFDHIRVDYKETSNQKGFVFRQVKGE